MTVCLLCLIGYWVNYIQLSYNLNNPLIPKEAFLRHMFKFTVIRSAPKLIIAIICGWYLFRKRFFRPIAVTSISILILEAIFEADVYDYCMP